MIDLYKTCFISNGSLVKKELFGALMPPDLVVNLPDFIKRHTDKTVLPLEFCRLNNLCSVYGAVFLANKHLAQPVLFVRRRFSWCFLAPAGLPADVQFNLLPLYFSPTLNELCWEIKTADSLAYLIRILLSLPGGYLGMSSIPAVMTELANLFILTEQELSCA